MCLFEEIRIMFYRNHIVSALSFWWIIYPSMLKKVRMGFELYPSNSNVTNQIQILYSAAHVNRHASVSSSDWPKVASVLFNKVANLDICAPFPVELLISGFENPRGSSIMWLVFWPAHIPLGSLWSDQLHRSHLCKHQHIEVWNTFH